MVSESLIVNEVTYGEAASGAAIVQGTTVQDGARTAKTATSFRRGPRTTEETTEVALREGKEEIDRLANALKIPGTETSAAHHLYTLARLHHFHRPRRENAAICLYTACRQSKINGIMLIDFADQLRVNVFELGATYKQFLKAIGLEQEVEEIPQLEIEPLLLRYAKRLEFGGAHENHRIANDAALVVSRMERDWVKTGRQPAAIIGASLILAARMNNYRRTLREIVYVVKAGEITIQKRLEEFRRTKAGRMTVQQFRELGHLLKPQTEPPVLYEARLKEMRKRKLDEITQGDEEDPGPAADDSAANQSIREATPSREPRRDKDGFVIPDHPNPRTSRSLSATSADKGLKTTDTGEPENPNNTNSNEASKGKLGRKRKRRRVEEPEPFIPTPDELIQEDGELEDQIDQLVDRLSVDEMYAIAVARARDIAESERLKEELENTRPATSDDVELGLNEFDDDPEVKHCKLSDVEIACKEKIWVTQNWDWLRREQQKILDAELAEAQGKRKRKKKVTGPRKTRRPVLEGESPASAAEATMIMLRKRVKKKSVFSKHLNYEKLQRVYSIPGTPQSTTTAPSQDSSAAPSEAASPPPETTDVLRRKGLPTPSATQSQEPGAAGRSGTKDRPVPVADDDSSSSSDGEDGDAKGADDVEMSDTENDGDDDDDGRDHFEDEYDYDEETWGHSDEDEDLDEDEVFG